MSRNGAILIIEDDTDDKQVLEDIIRDLGYKNPIRWMGNSEVAYNYLRDTDEQMFIIFSDINLPFCNGLEFKKRINADERLRKKSIPFVFYSTHAGQKTVDDAYEDMTVQGFFKKGSNYAEMRELL